MDPVQSTGPKTNASCSKEFPIPCLNFDANTTFAGPDITTISVDQYECCDGIMLYNHFFWKFC